MSGLAPTVAPGSETPITVTLPFADLLEALRRQGFEIGVDHYVRLHTLLGRIGGECEPRELRTLLCPIFATSKEAQEQFYRVFDQQYQLFVVQPASEADYTGENEAGALAFSSAASGKPRRRLLYLGVVLFALSVFGIWYRWSTRSEAATPPVVVSPPTDSARPQAELQPTPPTPAPVPLPFPEVTRPSAWKTLAMPLSLILMPLAVFGLYEWYRFRQRKLILQKQRRDKPPIVWPIRVPSMANPYAEAEEFYGAARSLRQREAGAAQRLALEETIAATIAARGYPTFRYRSDTRPPDYLLLIERATFRDHQAELFNSLAAALEREGVHVARYYYDADPRVCYPEPGETGVLLLELQRRHPTHRLLVFGTGDKMIDPISGRLHAWVEAFVGWTDRALLTPELPSHWARREVVLARHFIVLPSTVGGLRAVREHFGSHVHPEPEQWWGNGSDSFPDDSSPAAVVRVLRVSLGDDVFQWLCTCALYPELYWDLTLYLGSLPSLREGVISEANLLRLIRLPWFRTGSIPDEVRAALIEQLDPEVATAARLAIVELLEQNPPPHDAVAVTRYQLDLAVQRLALSARDRKRRRELLRQIGRIPRGQVMQDRALVGLLERAPRSRLGLILPRRLRRVFYDRGIPAFGWRMAVRLSVAVALTIGIAAIAIAPYLIKTRVSYLLNQDLEARVREATRGVAALASTGVPASLDELRRLDSLRVQVARLGRYGKSGPPLPLQWGQYRGSTLFIQAREAYFIAFEKLLWMPTRTNINNWLTGLPALAWINGDYESVFVALKAYLVTTQYADSAKRNFLAPALMRFWSMNSVIDAERWTLADSQFAFFADELPEGNPYNHEADRALVQRTRALLRSFAGDEQLYAHLLTVAGESLAPIRWSGAPVRNDFVVPAAFTAAGWTKAIATLGNVDKLFNRETWVVGEGAVPGQDRQRLEHELRIRYIDEYINTWISYLKSGDIGAFAGAPEAALKLAALATPASPLLRMIGLASDNTAGLDSITVGRTFRPAHIVSAPKSTTTTAAGGKYVNSLTSLQAAIQLVSTSAVGPIRDQAVAQANLAATQAKAVVSEISQGFELRGPTRAVGGAIRTLLQQPVTSAEAALGRVPIVLSRLDPDELSARLARDSADVQARTLLAVTYLQSGRAAQALPLLEGAVARRPNDAPALLYLGLASEELKLYGQARRTYESYLNAGRSEQVLTSVRRRLKLLARRELEDAVRTAVARESQLARVEPQANVVAVLPFRALVQDSQMHTLGRVMADFLHIDLSQSNRLRVISQLQVQLLINEIKLAERALTDPASALRVGRLLGAERIVQGSLGSLEQAGDLNASMVRVGATTPQGAPSVFAERETLDRIVEAEKRLALRIYQSLGVTLTIAERELVTRRPTQNLRAILAYGLGLEALDAGDFSIAAEHFSAAASLDPSFSMARMQAAEAREILAAAGTTTSSLIAAGLTEFTLEPPSR